MNVRPKSKTGGASADEILRDLHRQLGEAERNGDTQQARQLQGQINTKIKMKYYKLVKGKTVLIYRLCRGWFF